MTIGRLHKISLAATAMVGPLGILSGSPLLAGSGGVVIAVILFLAWKPQAPTRRMAVVVHGITVSILLYALSIFGSARIDSVLLILLLGLTNRYVLRAGHRDDFLVVAAAAVLLAAATTVTPGVGFAALLIAFVPAVLWTLWSAMILGAAEGEPAAHAAMSRRPLPRGMASLALTGLALTAAGYAAVSVLPRFRFNAFLSAGAFMGLPGASDSMTLTTGGVSDRSDGTVVLRVTPKGDKPPSLEGLYARLYALDQFDGVRWSSSNLGHFGFAANNGFRRRSEERVETSTSVQEVEVSLERLTRARGHHPVVTLGFGYPSETRYPQVHEDLSGTWVIDGFNGRSLVYPIRLGDRFKAARISPVYEGKRNTILTTVPEGLDPRVVALGKKLAEGKETPHEKIDAVVRHLAIGFSYSLDALEGESGDPLARFLFESKKGHCELYAGAVAALLRVAGLKTRVATGYYNGAWNPLGGYAAFTAQDAHAWAEVWIDGEGWTWVDATPESSRVRKAPSLWAMIGQWYDALERTWYDNVVDFDNDRQRRLFASITERLERAGGPLGTLFGGGEDEEGGSPVRRGGGWLLGLLAAGGLGAGGWSIARRRARPEAVGHRLRKVLGERRDENVTLGALLARADARVREVAAPVVSEYEALRFGGAAAGKDAIAALSKRVRQLDLDLKKKRPT